MIPNQIDLSDARWFPVDLNVQTRRFAFLAIDEQVLERSSFLDTRLEAPLDAAVPIAADEVDALAVSPRLGWLFHTSFCGSTLLARILHSPPHGVCLREPMVLRRLGDARHAGQTIDSLLPLTVALLSRPWHAEGSVVVKPTHAALNTAQDLLDVSPESRAVVLTSSLEDFLVSNLKKTPESQSKIPQLVERAMQASDFHRRLPPAAFAPPSLLGAAVLQWAAQREVIADAIGNAGSGRMRVVDMQQLLDDLFDIASGVSSWLSLDLPAATLESRCRAESGRNAKATDAPYSASQRAEEKRFIETSFAAELSRARAWADTNVLPFMREAARTATSQWRLT